MWQLIGAALGGMFGGGKGKILAGALGGALGSKADQNAEQRQADARYGNSYIRMADAARKAGLHPLEVLRAGDPAGSRQPTVMSMAARMGQYDQIDSLLTGQKAEQLTSTRLQNELMAIQIEQAKTGMLGGGAAAPAPRSYVGGAPFLGNSDVDADTDGPVLGELEPQVLPHGVEIPKLHDAEVAAPKVFPLPWRQSTGWPSGEDVEGAYSDIGGLVYAPFKAMNDAIINLEYHLKRQWRETYTMMTQTQRAATKPNYRGEFSTLNNGLRSNYGRPGSRSGF